MLKVDVKSESSVKKTLSVAIPEEQVSSEFDQAYRDLAKKAQIPGFRKGKVPRNVLEKRFHTAVESEVFESLIRDSMVKAFQDNELEPVAQPRITEHKHDKGKGLTYTASIEVKPQFEPKDYKGIKLKKTSDKITEKQVNEVLERLQNEQGILQEREGVETPAKGDFVSVTIQGLDEEGNLTHPDQEPQERLYEMGGEILQEQMEKALSKMKVDEEKAVTITPKTQDKKEKAKDLHFRICLKAIKEKVLPKIDDEFAKSVGPFENLDALKERARNDLKEELKQKNRVDMATNALEELRKKNPVEFPESLVERELLSMMYNLWRQLEQAGMKEIPEEYSEKKLRERMKPEAELRVHDQLIMEAIAKKEGLEVAPEEINERIKEMAGQAKAPFAEYRAYLEKNNQIENLHFQMLTQKTLDFLLAEATIK